MKFFFSLWGRGDCRPPPSAPAPRDGERGVALLLTLGILSLLLILGMSFAFSTRTERMAAGVNADLTRARLLAESGLDRTLAYLKYAFPYDATGVAPATGTPPSFSPWDSRVLFPATSGALFEKGPAATDWANRYFSPSRNTSADAVGIETALATNLGFPFVPNGTPFANQSWHHIEDADSNKLVGRIAFIIVDESGKIDPNGVMTLQHEPTTGTYYADVNGNGSFTDAPVAEGGEVRSGATPEEINGENAFTGITAGTLVDNLPANGKRWFSWDHLRKGLWAAASTNDSYAQAATKAVFPYSQDIEAWNENGTDKHRFDLFGSATTWDATSFDILRSGGTGSTSNYWTGTPPAVNSTVTTCIPWLRTLTDASGTSVSNQVIANLIDYCDTDSVATSNFATTGGAPTYVGLEKVAYINEVIFTADADKSNDRLTVSVTVELVNLYAETVPDGYLTVVATVKEDSATNVRTFIWPTAITVDPGTYKDAGVQSVVSVATQGKVKVTIMDAKVYWSAASAYAASNLYDFAFINTPSTMHQTNPGASVETRVTSCQVADPRCNTSYAGNWTWDTTWASTNGTPGALNNPIANPTMANPSGRSPSGDTETVSDPVSGISTAYIRNGPMQSLWELGAIHRGEPWCTLKLSKYNSTGGTSYKYTDGDANILEQVKLGGFVAGPGKFNANSAQPEAWRAVLKGVTVGAAGTAPTNHGYDAPATGTPLSAAAADLISPYPAATTAGTILATNGATGGTPGNNRGKIADALKLSDGTGGTQTTDRAKEEIIGKIANLLTVRQNYFSIIVTAQAVKDFGTSVSSLPAPTRQAHADWVKYFDGGGATDKWCAILAEQKLLAIVYRDAFTNKFKIERVEYLEE